MSYRAVKGSTALGTEFKFEGPGMPRYANGVHFLQVPCEWALDCLGREEKGGEHGTHDAQTIVGLLHAAFEAGRQDAKREIREVLGVFNPR